MKNISHHLLLTTAARWSRSCSALNRRYDNCRRRSGYNDKLESVVMPWQAAVHPFIGVPRCANYNHALKSRSNESNEITMPPHRQPALPSKCRQIRCLSHSRLSPLLMPWTRCIRYEPFRPHVSKLDMLETTAPRAC